MTLRTPCVLYKLKYDFRKYRSNKINRTDTDYSSILPAYLYQVSVGRHVQEHSLTSFLFISTRPQDEKLHSFNRDQNRISRTFEVAQLIQIELLPFLTYFRRIMFMTLIKVNCFPSII